MVALAIILVLLGIVVFGYRRVATGSQEKQTRTVLERLRNMTSVLTSNKAAGQTFFQQRIPYLYASPLGAGDPSTAAGTLPLWEAVPAYGGTVLDTGATMSHDALYRTALILNVLNASPEAKAIFAELPTQRRRRMNFDRQNNGRIVASGGANILTVEMPLDAWDNPILFVYDNWQIPISPTVSNLRLLPPPTGGDTGGLTNLISTSARGYWQPTQQPVVPLTVPPNPPAAFTPPTGYTQLGTAVRSADRQPFWASGGADGLMVTNDDNVYSFDN